MAGAKHVSVYFLLINLGPSPMPYGFANENEFFSLPAFCDRFFWPRPTSQGQGPWDRACSKPRTQFFLWCLPRLIAGADSSALHDFPPFNIFVRDSSGSWVHLLFSSHVARPTMHGVQCPVPKSGEVQLGAKHVGLPFGLAQPYHPTQHRCPSGLPA